MSIASRLTKLESMRPSRIVLLARMPDGTEREMSAPDFIKSAKDGADFIRVMRGSDLKDVDLILSTFQSVIE